jgi:hypothetical protein
MMDPSRSLPGPLRIAAVCAALLACAASADAQNSSQQGSLQLGAELRMWLPSFDGAMQVDTETVTGTSIRFDSTLDLEERPEVWGFGMALGDRRYGRLAYDYTLFTAPGNKVLTRDVVFGGRTFYLPETVHTDFRVDINRISLSYIKSVEGNFLLQAEIGLALFKWKASIANRQLGEKISEDSRSSVPLTGLHAILPLGDSINFCMGVSGVFFQTGSDNVDWVETYLSIDITLGDFLMIGLGYRHLDLKAELDLNGSQSGEIDMKLSGVYFILGIKL